MKINPNDYAFPINALEHGICPGLSIRAEFAKAAMAGFLSSPDFSNDDPQKIAAWSIEMADALIAELNKNQPK